MVGAGMSKKQTAVPPSSKGTGMIPGQGKASEQSEASTGAALPVEDKAKNDAPKQGQATGPDRAALVALAAGIRTYLQLHQQMGIKDYPLTPGLRQYLSVKKPPVKADFRPQVQQTPPPVRPKDAPLPTTPATAEQFAALHQDIRSCRLCDLTSARQGQVVGAGTVTARLLIIGDYSSQTAGCSATTLFGAEEDTLLWNMMRAIGLSPEDVYVTNTVKCCPLPPDPPEAIHAQRCLAYLRREIELVRPRIICAMGEAAAQSVLEGSEPVSRLRGRFHRYRYGHEGADTIPIMVTFHPRFLLGCPDMKKATWLDLQMIQRQLQAR